MPKVRQMFHSKYFPFRSNKKLQAALESFRAIPILSIAGARQGFGGAPTRPLRGRHIQRVPSRSTGNGTAIRTRGCSPEERSAERDCREGEQILSRDGDTVKRLPEARRQLYGTDLSRIVLFQWSSLSDPSSSIIWSDIRHDKNYPF